MTAIGAGLGCMRDRRSEVVVTLKEILLCHTGGGLGRRPRRTPGEGAPAIASGYCPQATSERNRSASGVYLDRLASALLVSSYLADLCQLSPSYPPGPSSLSSANKLSPLTLMSHTHTIAASSSNFHPIFSALRTKNDILLHPLAARLQSCGSPQFNASCILISQREISLPKKVNNTLPKNETDRTNTLQDIIS